MPSFNLSANFEAHGGFSCKYGSGLCTNGNYYDEQFAYFGVAVPDGSALIGSGLTMFGAQVTQGQNPNDANLNNFISASLQANGSTFVGVNGEGTLNQLTDAITFDPVQGFLMAAYFRTWDRSGDTSSVAKFSSVTFSFNEIGPQAPPEGSPIPEPASMTLLGTGLLALARRRFTKKA